MEIAAQLVKDLRQRSGAGFMDCKAALVEASGDAEKAFELLRKKNKVKAESKAGRVAAEGLVYSYIHAGGRIGVLVEVNCETDFAAQSDVFKDLVKDIAMHIAAADPAHLVRDEVTQQVIAREREVYTEQARGTGKPAAAIAKIVENKLEKYFSDVCLYEQPFVKDPSVSIKDLVQQSAGRIGENVQIRRYARFQLGEGIKKPQEATA